MSVDSDLHDKTLTFEQFPRLSPASLSSQAIPFILSVVDAFIIIVSSIAGAIVYQTATYHSSLDIESQLAVGVLASTFYVLLMNRRGLYEVSTATSSVEVREILIYWFTTALLLALVAFLLKVGGTFSRVTFVIFCLTTPIVLLGIRKLTKVVLAEAIGSGFIGRRDAVLIGESSEVMAFRPRDLLSICGAVEVKRFALSQEDDPEARTAADGQVINLLAHFVRRHDCREILVALPWSDSQRIEFIRDRIKALPVAARLLPDTRVRSLTALPWPARNRSFSIELQRAPLNGAQRVSKRAVDIVVSALALIFFLPLMTLTALAIRLESPGPVIFRQTRKGFNGREFTIYKFRTMTVQENGTTIVQATPGDSRVTGLGRILRSSSIDELPQLVNVLRGDMSLVGPRPHALAHDDYFETVLSDYAFRHHVKPGITGWAQCNGARGATPSVEHISERVKLDLWYINNWSFWLDIQILFKTMFEVLRKHNAY
jgi:undecaprenyl-phosphate galactose phosphotransferase/putative colanic acid biosynthesis UDP-glucose lipid carrier transferase